MGNRQDNCSEDRDSDGHEPSGEHEGVTHDKQDSEPDAGDINDCEAPGNREHVGQGSIDGGISEMDESSTGQEPEERRRESYGEDAAPREERRSSNEERGKIVTNSDDRAELEESAWYMIRQLKAIKHNEAI